MSRRLAPLLFTLATAACTTPASTTPASTIALDGPPSTRALAPGVHAFDAPQLAGGCEAFGPWQRTERHPVVAPEPAGIVVEVQHVRSPEWLDAIASGDLWSTGPTGATAALWWQLYKATYSRIDGDTCRFAPSCSRFGLEAVHAHGPRGIAMTFGRLIRNQNDPSFYRPLSNSRLLADPLSNYRLDEGAPRLDDFARHDDRAHAWYHHVAATQRIVWPATATTTAATTTAATTPATTSAPPGTGD